MPGTVKLIRADDRPQLHVVRVTISHRFGNEEECGYGLASNPVVRLSPGLWLGGCELPGWGPP